jgi:hypothetical protein
MKRQFHICHSLLWTLSGRFETYVGCCESTLDFVFNVGYFFTRRHMNDLTELELQDAQSERTARAQSALQGGRFRVARVSPQLWAVQNGSNQPYTVTLQQTECDPIWTCTCMDYRQRGPQIRCKHIEGVRLCEAAQNHTTIYKENLMDPTQAQESDLPDAQSDRAVWELRQPLDMSRVKRRQAPAMGSVPYLEGFDVIDRANTIFNYQWSFALASQPIVLRWERHVLAWDNKLRKKVPVLQDGQPVTEEVGLVYITGTLVVEIGGRQHEHADIGRCIFGGDTPEALDMALAGSATDCLKRCFRHLGEQFGSMFYDKDITQNTRTPPQGGIPKGRQYIDGTTVNGNRNEQEAYDQYKEKTGKTPTSRDVLRAWLSSLRPAPAAEKEKTSTVAV